MISFFFRRRSRKVQEISKVSIDSEEETQITSSSDESPSHAELAMPDTELPDEGKGPYAVIELGVPGYESMVEIVPENQYPVAELGT